MSMEALLDAVESRIRSACSYSSAECGVQADGMPPPSAGQVYVSVHAGGWDNADLDASCLDESLSVFVTVTMRLAHFPRDRQAAEGVRKAATGLYARAEAIRAALHMSYEVIAAANLAAGAIELTSGAGAQSVNGFIEPLKFRSGTRPYRQQADWHTASAEGDGSDPAFSVELTFVGARRVQRIEHQA